MKPWTSAQAAVRPLRSTRQTYSGVNVLNLWLDADEKEFSSPYWFGFHTALKMGACARKVEKGSAIPVTRALACLWSRIWCAVHRFCPATGYPSQKSAAMRFAILIRMMRRTSSKGFGRCEMMRSGRRCGPDDFSEPDSMIGIVWLSASGTGSASRQSKNVSASAACLADAKLCHEVCC